MNLVVMNKSKSWVLATCVWSWFSLALVLGDGLDGLAREAVVDALGQPVGTAAMGGAEFLQDAVKQSTLDDQDFMAKPSAARLKFWLSFHRTYPEVDVSSQIRAAQGEVAAQREERRKVEEKIQEGMRNPPVAMSRSKLKRYRRGHYPAAGAVRNIQLRKELLPDEFGSD